ncbi:MAG: hypothetical protein WBE76_26300 [Terracidiphilus sp.]
MKTTKAVARSVLPSFLFERLKAARWRRGMSRYLEKEGLLDAAARYVERNGYTVRYGPFAGMVYPRRAALNYHSIPGLLGVYEQELHPVIEAIARRKYDLVINIGCAEGYYAVGLARLLRTKVLAYDPEPVERDICREAAELNDVSGLVELKDLFRPSEIQKFRGMRVFCISDCEGFEEQIFTRHTISQTAGWDLLIELHGAAADKLMSLAWPQKMTTIESVPRTGSYKELEGLGATKKLLSENRATQKWLWCDSQARSISNQG